MSDFRKWLDGEHGRGVEIAGTLGVTPGAITQWADNQVPAPRVLDVERLTGISRHVLRPDVFGPAKGRAA
jgi:DNA-binding transcriptional regulator YdaS (Cro superfamily)